MNPLDEFLVCHLHYTVTQRLLEDTCRQLRDCNGTMEERQALVDETLRLAMSVVDLIDDCEGCIAETSAFIKKNGLDADLADALKLIANNLKEDRTRASAYAMFITAKRLGGSTRGPRRPMVANPFVFEDDSEDDGTEVEPASDETEHDKNGDSEEEEKNDEEPEGSSDGKEGTDDDESDDSEDEEPEEEAPDPMAERRECRAKIEEVNAMADEPFIFDPKDDLSDDDSFFTEEEEEESEDSEDDDIPEPEEDPVSEDPNPLVAETERITEELGEPTRLPPKNKEGRKGIFGKRRRFRWIWKPSVRWSPSPSYRCWPSSWGRTCAGTSMW